MPLGDREMLGLGEGVRVALEHDEALAHADEVRDTETQEVGEAVLHTVEEALSVPDCVLLPDTVGERLMEGVAVLEGQAVTERVMVLLPLLLGERVELTHTVLLRDMEGHAVPEALPVGVRVEVTHRVPDCVPEGLGDPDALGLAVADLHTVTLRERLGLTEVVKLLVAVTEVVLLVLEVKHAEGVVEAVGEMVLQLLWDMVPHRDMLPLRVRVSETVCVGLALGQAVTDLVMEGERDMLTEMVDVVLVLGLKV